MTFDPSGKDTTWDTRVFIPSDNNGYPLRVPFDPDGPGGLPPQAVRSILISENDQYQAGTYILIFEGKGKVQIRVDSKCPHLIDGQCIFEKPNVIHNFVVTKPTLGGLRLEIISSEESDHIRNIRIIPPGGLIENANDFHPDFIKLLRGFKIVRFMDWGSINHTQVVHWKDRVTTESYSYALHGAGVPYEVMLDLSNRVGSDPWIVIPSQADDDYVTNLARLIAGRLDRKNTLYLEYSNEAWNTIFPQTRYVSEMGDKLAAQMGLTLKMSDTNALFYAKRSVEIFEIFDREFGGNRKYFKILSGQGMNPSVARERLRWYQDQRINPRGFKADAISIALYFGSSTVDSLLTNSGKRDKKDIKVDDVMNISVDDLLSHAIKDLRSNRLPKMIEHRELASRNGMLLLAYEGGQSLRIGAGFNDLVVKAMTEKVILANRSEEMGIIYREMFDLWFENGGDSFVNFSFIYRPNRWGAWGILENQNQRFLSSPKYKAVKERLD